MIKSSAPGKLFIAGEYAVVESGYPAILVAVDRFIEVRLEKRSDSGWINSHGKQSISWLRKDGRIIPSQKKNVFSYLLSAINIVEAYVKEQGKVLDYYGLDIYS